MRRRDFCTAATLLGTITLMSAEPQLGGILDRLGGKGNTQPSVGNDKIVSGLREALQIGTGNAIALTGKPDGYFRNDAIKILLPEKVRGLEKGLRAIGMGAKVDEFELSMNRAAEKAAPAAKTIFISAIRSMTLDDGRKILTGGDTAATEFFKTKTSAELTSAFRPIVEKSMQETGVMGRYEQLLGGMPALPFMRKDSFNLTDYVVSKSLDGLFHMVGEEERKIRTNPAARVTSLLKDVFGNRSL